MSSVVGKENDWDVKGNHRKDQGTNSWTASRLNRKKLTSRALEKAGTSPGDLGMKDPSLDQAR